MDTVKYPHLFAPLRIRGVYFRNRLFSAPQGFYNDGPDRYPSEAAVAFYERKAVGGFASVCVGDCIVDAKTGKGLPWTRDMEDIENLNHMSKIAHAITRSGAVASAELSHDGMFSNYSKMTYGTKLYGPTAGEYRYGRVEEMPEEMILELADKFGKAAAFAKQCGFNMITIHAGHGWLLHQFMSHIFNHRTDKWGGSFENRMRFPLLVIDSIRKAVGEDTPIEFRFSGTEIDERGYGIDEGVRIAQAVDGKVDIIHVSVGLHEIDDTFIVVHPSMFLEDGCNSKYAREIKKHVSKSLVATVGAFTDPAHMEDFLATGGADIINVARQTLADPDFPIKARTGREDEIAPCIRCLQCFNNVGEHRIFRCTLNPEIGQELDVKMMPERAAHPKKVLVAGGGAGGMEAAIQAAKMGHTVTLCEKTDRLGGVLNCEEKVPFKKNLGRYLRRQERLLEVNGVTVKLNTPVTPALAEELKPDVIIASLGARPVVPPIPGIEKALLAEDVLMNVESVKGRRPGGPGAGHLAGAARPQGHDRRDGGETRHRHPGRRVHVLRHHHGQIGRRTEAFNESGGGKRRLPDRGDGGRTGGDPGGHRHLRRRAETPVRRGGRPRPLRAGVPSHRRLCEAGERPDGHPPGLRHCEKSGPGVISRQREYGRQKRIPGQVPGILFGVWMGIIYIYQI